MNPTSSSMQSETPYRRLDFEDGCEQQLECKIMEEDGNDDFSDLTGIHVLKDLDKIHSSIPKASLPEVGMEFDTEEAAHDFYLAYAKEVGFGIKKSKAHKDNSGKIMDRTFCCSAEGKRGKDKRNTNVRASRPETRCGCLARMKVNCRQTGKYRVVEFLSKHNHYLSSPHKTHLHRAHRKISSVHEAEIVIANSVGIPPKISHELMAKQAGGRENLGFIPEDYRNYLRSKRTREMKVGDTGGVLEYLQRMQLEDPNFFYAIQVDEDDLITNIFWADGKMKADYEDFGDVVCFDTTYRKNNEGRPFALFVGINNHKQTAIFGAALLYDETSLTFEWLFNTFETAMFGKRPKTILTDQDAAMAKALTSTWPDTFHRLCIWHIYQNAAKHLSGVFKEFKKFADDFSRCIYDFEEEEDFISAWNEMLEKYGLHDNDWLKRMFQLKEKWALVYGRETFCADMTTTQRSESMNNVIKRYASYKNKLLQFFNNFQRLVDERRYEELKADFRASISFPALPFEIGILKHAASTYTPEVFKCFQDQWSKSYDSNILICNVLGTITEYKVTPCRKTYSHTVKYDSSADTIDCSCKKYEFSGILCSHAWKVLNIRNILRIPNQYIQKRWTRKAKSGCDEVQTCSKKLSNLEPEVIVSMRYKELCRLYTKLVTKTAGTEDTYKIAKEGLFKMLEAVDTRLQSEELTFESTIADANLVNQIGKEASEMAGSKFKGVKIKNKTVTGKRLRGGLEKGSRKKKSTTKHSFSTDSATLALDFASQNVIIPAPPSLDDQPALTCHNEVSYLNSNIQNQVGSHVLSNESNFSMSMTELLEAQQPHGFGGFIMDNPEQFDGRNYKISASNVNGDKNCGCPIPCDGVAMCKCRDDG